MALPNSDTKVREPVLSLTTVVPDGTIKNEAGPRERTEPSEPAPRRWLGQRAQRETPEGRWVKLGVKGARFEQCGTWQYDPCRINAALLSSLSVIFLLPTRI